MGRGMPTITFRKKCLEDMFGFSGENLIFFESSDEVAYWIYFLLRNHKFRKELSERCEKYVHDKYDWYKRFNQIMIKQEIWKG
jgi:spore maturation protein CgeB